MRIRNLLSAALCAVTICAACVAGARAAEPAVTGDLAKLQGGWTATFGPQKIVLVLSIKGTAATMTLSSASGQTSKSKGELKIDENAKPEKTIDWVKFSATTGGTAPTNPGIYKLDGDSITICNGTPGNDRPTAFKAGEGGKPQLFVLTRKSAGAEAVPVETDIQKLQGTWDKTSSSYLGKESPLIREQLIIKGDEVTIVTEGRRAGSYRLKLDETQTPKSWDEIYRFAIPNIYKIEGEILTLCTTLGRTRPQEFVSSADKKTSISIWKRKK